MRVCSRALAREWGNQPVSWSTVLVKWPICVLLDVMCLLSPCCPVADVCILPLSSQCQIIYPRQQLLTLRELEMIGFIENNVSKLSLLLSEISRFEQT